MYTVLLVEDSKEIYQQVQSALSSFVNLTWAQDILTAKKAFEKNAYDLLLLDVELPDGNGVEFCAEALSKNPKLPIFFLSAHTDLPDKVMGFTAGADDYITKPFQSLELKARVEARIKKNQLMNERESKFTWEEIEVLPSRQEVFVKDGDSKRLVELTSLEFKILGLFCEKVGEVLSRDYLLNQVWGQDIHIYQRSVDTHVSKLRKKIAPVSHIVESIHGVGYKFNPHPEVNG